jgi:hypothetical protein
VGATASKRPSSATTRGWDNKNIKTPPSPYFAASSENMANRQGECSFRLHEMKYPVHVFSLRVICAYYQAASHPSPLYLAEASFPT